MLSGMNLLRPIERDVSVKGLRLHLLRGDLAAATAAAASLKSLGLHEGSLSPYPEVSVAPLRLLLAQGEYGAAIAGLTRLIATADRAGFALIAAHALVLRASAHAATGDSARAKADYHSALPLTSDKRVRADIERVLEK